MDWPRAKTYLIVAFFLLDLYLAQRFWAGGEGVFAPRWPLRAPSAARVKEELDRKGIVFLGRLPDRRVKALPMLSVRFAALEPERLADAFFQGRAGVTPTVLPGPPKGESFERGGDEQGGETLTVLEGGLVLYDRHNLKAIRQAWPLDPDQARRDADAFLESLGGLPAPVRFDVIWPVSSDPPVYQVLYVQHHDGWPVFAGYVGVEVAAGGVRSLRSQALQPLRFSGPPRPLRTAETALVELRKVLVGEGRMPLDEKLLVDRVDLGYYSKPREWAREWEMPPVWRILTKDGQFYYINAFTGLPEGLQEESPPPTVSTQIKK